MSQNETNLDQLFQSLAITTADDVFTLDDLTAALDATGMTELPSARDATGVSSAPSANTQRHVGLNARHHELHMEYPAYDLLRPGGIPHLARPRNMAYREQPHLAHYHIHDSNLGCVVRLNTPLQRVCYSSAPPFQQQNNFVEMINRLSEAPGVSTLGLMCYEYLGKLVYSMRLTTTWMTAFHQSTEVQTYGCYAEEFSGVIAALSGVPWADVLDDLVNRASDLSYLLVRDRMMKYSRTSAQDEWESLTWKTDSVNHILSDCFVYNTSEECDNKSFMDVLTFKRCGHVFRISRVYLFHVLTREDCLAFHCSQCGAHAMDSAARHKVSVLDDSKVRLEYRELDGMWSKMFSSLNPYAVFQVQNVELREALVDALALLNPPSSIMHPTQSQHNMPETEVLLAAFKARLINDTDTLIVAPCKTAHLLAKLATSALREYAGVDQTVKGYRYVPLGFGRFIHRWLKGAAILLAARVESKNQLVVDDLSSLFVGSRDVEMGEVTCLY